MKCAKELMELNAKATAAWLKAKEDREYVARINAICLCENDIAEALEACASNPKPTEIAYYERIIIRHNEYDSEVFHFLREDGAVYANGEKSYLVNMDTEYSLEALVAHLTSFCYKVEITEGFYKSYGSGDHVCKILCVKPEEVLGC